jgi:hypothetical protein
LTALSEGLRVPREWQSAQEEKEEKEKEEKEEVEEDGRASPHPTPPQRHYHFLVIHLAKAELLLSPSAIRHIARWHHRYI